MADYQSLNRQHLAYLRQQGASALAHQVQHLVRQDLVQTPEAARLQAQLEAHLQRLRSVQR